MASPREPFDIEEFWADLLAYIEDRCVIPIVGAELLTLVDGAESVPLYRAVAERLLDRYALSTAARAEIVLREHSELNDAVCALIAANRRVKDLYRPIHDILQELVGPVEPPAPLRQLASIRHFDLFATTTPDGLLARALGAGTVEIEYAPSLQEERRRDIPDQLQPGSASVFYLFGRVATTPFYYAIHDEDALEFACTLLQDGVPPPRMFSELRRRHLLLIGCNFPNWLSRLFLRSSNRERLSSPRPRYEFLVDRATGADRALTVFLERFSRDSRYYPLPAREFVAELYQRWEARNPPVGSGAGPHLTPAPAMSAGCGSIFISYASEDIGAARRLSEGVQRVGFNSVWLDKSELKPGDEWPRHISGAIQRCHLFLPLISSTTERRTEGYFRREWNAAAERLQMIQGRKFILPVVIDADAGASLAAYALVPEAFRQLHYGHAPGGEMSPDLEATLGEEQRRMQREKVR